MLKKLKEMKGPTSIYTPLGPSSIVVTYEIRVFFEGAEKKVFSSIF
jgi:hypothetical protein